MKAKTISKIALRSSIILASVSFFLSFQTAQAVQVNLKGYAWSDVPEDVQTVANGAGWIKFSGPGYQVQVDSETGNLSGYAWSENYGWLSFNSADVTGCPTNNVSNQTCQPKLNLTTGAVTGWAKFINAPSGIGDYYNGWVSLKGSNYGVDSDPFPIEARSALITFTSITPSNGNWKVMPGNITGSGVGSVSVVPAVTGTSYTISGITPPPSGYNPSWTCTNTITGSTCAVTLWPDDRVGFTLAYQLATQPPPGDPPPGDPPPPAFDYSLSVNPSSKTIEAGQTDFVNVTANRISGSDQVSFSIPNKPSWLNVSFSPQPCNLRVVASCTTALTLNPYRSAPLGIYTITVEGGIAPVRTTTFSLEVTRALTPGCTVVGSPSGSSFKVGEPVIWNAIDISGGQSPYNYLSWTSAGGEPSSAPTPVGTSYTTTYSTVGIKTARFTLQDTAGSPRTGSCTGSVRVGVNPGFGEF